ncbi:LysR family transcriptional regulator [Piscinibacter sp. HJYY11]|uniref:LysR family transcriptional regulator n=1 Tax=Piscinibacter sp. HJYY11 TaxID=2801333 RepID=UPI00191ECF5E|nr:LysR family transcriptional regulator [Piscinibacter sp. HJYY11]MBL0726608.1 LysR family transcriptional regulator [Piscinibacter sp. HJYY11]
MGVFDNLEDLKTFVQVVECGSLSAAARALQVTVNAVSRRVMRLEMNLGVKLLRRSTRAASVTDEGRLLYERARQVLAVLDAAEEEVRGTGGALKGLIRVGLSGGACSVAVLGGIGQLLDEHPDLRLQVLITNRAADPIGGGLDIALHVGPPQDSRLVARHLARASWLLAAAPSYFAAGREMPRSPDDLRAHRCLRIASDVAQDHWTLTDASGTLHRVAVRGNFESDDSRALSDATYAGIGIGIRPQRELLDAVARGTLVHVLPEYRFEPLDVYALMPSGTARLPRMSAFLDSLEQVFKTAL